MYETCNDHADARGEPPGCQKALRVSYRIGRGMFGDEAKFRIGIDKAGDEPGASHPVNTDMLSGDPFHGGVMSPLYGLGCRKFVGRGARQNNLGGAPAETDWRGRHDRIDRVVGPLKLVDIPPGWRLKIVE